MRVLTPTLSLVLVAGLPLVARPASLSSGAHDAIRFERSATAEFRQRVHGCLVDVAHAGRPGREFLAKLAAAPVSVVEEAGLNWAERAPPGRRQRIHWDPATHGEYADGAAKLPCAILLHELTHAYENYLGLYSGEFQAMRMENWFIWRWSAIARGRYQQRFYNQIREVRMPREILWPQAPSPPPPGPKRLPPTASDWQPNGASS